MRWWILAPAALAVAVQWMVATAGTGSLAIADARYSTTLYRQQADGFAAGSLALPVRPPDSLLALPDPYEPAARRNVCAVHDASLFNGNYFLYFGPLPALGLLGADALLGRQTSDALVAVAPALALAAFAFVAAREMLRAVVPGVPASLGVAIGAVAALGSPMPFLLSRPGVYEAAIASGQLLLLAGLICALRAARGSPIWWLAAGTAWGLVPFARASLIPAVAVLALGFAAWRAPRRVALLGSPLLVCALALGWYNAARFGSPLEFGQRYQLTDLNLRRDYDRFFSPANVGPNLALFLGRPPQLLPRFPFVAWAPAEERRADMRAAEAGTILEPTVGLLWTTPFLVLAAALAFATPGARRPAAVLAIASIAAIGPVLLQRWVAMRYLGDVAPLAALAAGLGAAALWQRAGRWRGAVVAGAASLAAVSVGASLLLAATGVDDHLERRNSALFALLGGQPAPPRMSPLGARFGESAELLSWRLAPERIQPGATTTLVTQWRGSGSARVRVLDADFRPVADLPGLPIAATGETRWVLPIPGDTQGPEQLAIEVSLLGAGGPLPVRDRDGRPIGNHATIGPLRLSGDFWPPPDADDRHVRFGDEMRLAAIRTARDGASLSVELFWRGGWVEEERLITLRLLDSTGRAVAQVRGDPRGGRLATLAWRPGDQIRDEWELALPVRLPPGEYRLWLGVERCQGPITPRGDPHIATIRLG